MTETQHLTGDGKNMNYPEVFVLGSFLLGLIFPEWIITFSKNKVSYPLGMNLISGFAFAAIAAGVVL